ncbi:hypothetical protein ACFS7Z_26870 [Pontibacter toksunensis]|uniref:Transposase n=1 Tax=Pontibacter toksunensis TaxID=1332631 RepID=A0ABW6C4C2_9BACT
MDTHARQKVVGIDVSKDSLAVCHLADGKMEHLEPKNSKLVLSNWSSAAGRTACM